MTRNGKIARLPKAVQEQLNQRLDDHKQGKRLVAWLNSLPDTQRVLATDFDGKPIREQNLSDWKQGGYRDWQRQQARRELFQQLPAEAGELGGVLDGEAFNRQLSVVLTADLALAGREVADKVKDPGKRAECLAQLAGKIALLRREESNKASVPGRVHSFSQDRWLAARTRGFQPVVGSRPGRIVGQVFAHGAVVVGGAPPPTSRMVLPPPCL